MRFNDRELATVSEGKAELEGRLFYKRTGGNRTQPGFKERWFKLRFNILFYYNLSETGNVIDDKPSGAIILENCSAAVEEFAETPFTFSVTFQDDYERKHVFSGRSDENVAKWIAQLNSASYGHLRASLKNLQNQLSFLTGQDPLLMYYRNEGSNVPEIDTAAGEPKKLTKKSTFRSYVNREAAILPPSMTDLSFVEDYFGNSLNAIGSEVVSRTKEEMKDPIPTMRARPQPLRKAPDPPTVKKPSDMPPPPRPPRGQKVPVSHNNLIDL